MESLRSLVSDCLGGPADSGVTCDGVPFSVHAAAGPPEVVPRTTTPSHVRHRHGKMGHVHRGELHGVPVLVSFRGEDLQPGDLVSLQEFFASRGGLFSSKTPGDHCGDEKHNEPPATKARLDGVFRTWGLSIGETELMN